MSRYVPLKDLKMLLGRCGARCALCGVVCDTGGDDASTTTVFGETAHIHAHSDEGPRGCYDLNDEERNRYPNLIWVCASCHKKIDDQPLVYTAEFLQAKKKEIQAWKSGAEHAAMLSIGFRELQGVCSLLAIQGHGGPPSSLDLPLRPDEKIARNGLSQEVASIITLGLGKVKEVERAMKLVSDGDENIQQRIVDRFKGEYLTKRGRGIVGDELFESMREFAFGLHPDPIMSAAGLAVLVYLFERCEVFES